MTHPRDRRRHERPAGRRRAARRHRSPPSSTSALLPDTPAPGLVEFDADARWPRSPLEVARAVLAEGGPVDAVGIANQRASTIVWDRATGEPVGPGLGWQDLRTVGTCLVLQADGHPPRPERVGHQGRPTCSTRPTPTARATCASAPSTPGSPGTSPRARCTSPTPPTPASPACCRGDGSDWDDKVLDALRIPAALLPHGRRLDRRARPGHRARRRAADRRARRRPAGDPRRPGLRAARPGQDHLRHRRHARPAPRRRAPALRRARATAAASRSWPGGAAARRRGASRR